MDIQQIRLKNFRYWADKLGREELASRMGYQDTNYLNQLYKQHENIGKSSARKLEAAVGLPPGGMDHPHYDLGENDRLIKLLLAAKSLTPAQLDKVVAVAIELQRDAGGSAHNQ